MVTLRVMITTERVADGTVLLVKLDDGKANAFTASAIAEITTHIDAAAADENIAAVVIAGRKGRFSGGFDLGVMRGDDIQAILDLVADGGDLVRHAYAAPIPVVAACTGHAVAAGALMLLGCDVRVGALGDVKIGLNEVAIGMVLPDWAMTIASERLSKRHLQRCVANARLLNGSEAVDAGFLDEAVEPERVIDRAIELAAEFTALQPNAYAGTMLKFRAETAAAMAEQAAAMRTL